MEYVYATRVLQCGSGVENAETLLKEKVLQIAPCVSENGIANYSFNFIDWPSNYVEGDPKKKRKTVLQVLPILPRLRWKRQNGSCPFMVRTLVSATSC